MGTIVTVDPITTKIGENITLTAYVLDENGNKVSGGNLIFKINGLTLKSDGKFGSEASPLKFIVVKGIVKYNLTLDLYLKNSENISASYSGSYNFYENKTLSEAHITIQNRDASLTVTTNPKMVKQNDTITFTAMLTDVTKDSNIKEIIETDDDFVIFKINGKTIKDENNSTLKVPVIDGEAVYDFAVPRGYSGFVNGSIRDYNVTCKYSSKVYNPEVVNNTVFNIERSPVTINITDVTVNNRTLKLSADIYDELGLNVIGINKYCVKLNGKTYKVNDEYASFDAKNGKIDVTLTLPESVGKLKKVQIVTGERQAYLGGSSEVLNII